MGNVLITGGGSGADLDVVTATANDVASPKVFVNQDGEPVTGTLPNLSEETDITHAEGNPTPVILGDSAFISTNTDGTIRAEIRYNGEKGIINPNSLLAVPQGTMASVGQLTAAKLIQGQNAFGITGTATSDATATNDLVYSGSVYYAKGNRGVGTMPDITNEASNITHSTSNNTPVVTNTSAYMSTNSDGVLRAEVGYNGNSGYIFKGTLFGVPAATMASAGGLTAAKLVKGQSAFGITGTGAGYVNANYNLWNGNIPATYVPSGDFGKAVLLQNYTITNATLASATAIIIETSIGGNGFNTILLLNSTNSLMLTQDGSHGGPTNFTIRIPNTDYTFYPYFSIIGYRSTFEILEMSIRIRKDSGSGTLPQTSGLSIKITHCFTV